MRGAEFDLDESLATMGTIYSQLQLFSAKEIDSSRARRLSDDIDEEGNRLDDLLAAMDEVYNE
ncbi:MAG: hypothetical protein B6243_09190 [Anaerolineaceae bacterium 4572_5.2]|nr:MAG: hypothetical protein B6243_09190 [Anaerolineaceae bacterium 4572_5.2]